MKIEGYKSAMAHCFTRMACPLGLYALPNSISGSIGTNHIYISVSAVVLPRDVSAVATHVVSRHGLLYPSKRLQL